MWIVVVDTTPEGRVAKYADFPTKAQADAHILRVQGIYPNAFAVEGDGLVVTDLLVSGQSVTTVPRPQPTRQDTPATTAIKRIALATGVDISDLQL